MEGRWRVEKFPWKVGDWTFCVHGPPLKADLFQEESQVLCSQYDASCGYSEGWSEEFSSRELKR